jgi:hypothetical protein
MEKEEWRRGKNGGCIVSNIIPQRTQYKDSDFESEKEYYGGYLIAESIPDEKTLNLMLSAPDLLEALQNIENDDNSIPSTIWKMRNDAIKKATE